MPSPWRGPRRLPEPVWPASQPNGAYAIELLHKCHLPPKSLADALVKIGAAHGKAAPPNEFSHLSTHPATFERVATIRALAATKR